MSPGLKAWRAHLECGDATPTSVAAKAGNHLSCGTCHTQQQIVRVSRVVVELVQGELFTTAECEEAA